MADFKRSDVIAAFNDIVHKAATFDDMYAALKHILHDAYGVRIDQADAGYYAVRDTDTAQYLHDSLSFTSCLEWIHANRKLRSLESPVE